MTERRLLGNMLIEQMLYLIACALHDVMPDKRKLEGLNLSYLYHLASAQSLAAMICMALEATDIFENAAPRVVKCWTDARDKAIRKNILMDAEREQVSHEMDKAGIWYMPLKGSILKELYPKFGMREMADIDMLYDAAFQFQLKEIMVKQGYETKSIGKGINDVYEKPPIYSFEMHTALVDSSRTPVWTAYYADVKKRLIADHEETQAFHFTDEDFYIYMNIHACKHYQGSGNGLRMLVDSYVLNRTKGSTWNREYIQAELEKLGIARFEEQSRTLAEKLFGTARPVSLTELSGPEQEMLLYCVGSGTYGTMKNLVKNEMKALQPDGKPISNRTKLRYYCSRLFPGREWCRLRYPFFYRHPLLLPFLWIYRVVHGVLFKNQQVMTEVRAVKRIEK